MAITPQAIKDQEFQTKFRGFDSIEVKSYLELVADEFFELLEKIRQQDEGLASLRKEKEQLEDVRKTLEADVEAAQRSVRALRSQIREKEDREAELLKEMEELQTTLADFDQERKDYEEEISEAEERISAINKKVAASKIEIDGLHNKIRMYEEQNRELRKEEVDFKRTIGVAQRFADDLREQTRKQTDALLRESKAKVRRALQAARDEIERLRQEAFAELSRLPEEIERLYKQRKKVQDDLRILLAGHLEELDSFSVDEYAITHYEFDELFQKIEIADITAALVINDEPPAANQAVDASSEPAVLQGLDELDYINMELPMGEEPVSDDTDDDLRNKLQDGGVAFLSDE